MAILYLQMTFLSRENDGYRMGNGYRFAIKMAVLKGVKPVGFGSVFRTWNRCKDPIRLIFIQLSIINGNFVFDVWYTHHGSYRCRFFGTSFPLILRTRLSTKCRIRSLRVIISTSAEKPGLIRYWSP